MSNDAIILRNVSKRFVFKAHKGFRGFFRPEKKEVKAVHEVSFTVKRGETVAFIGPNGAGKSTTIKMLSGILQPSNGQVEVLGYVPLKQRRELAMRIGTVFGQRSQLVFNLPLTDSFELSAKMYQVPDAVAQQRISLLIEQFGLGDFIDQPVRKLSLGQRMRAEVANALIHNPDIIFLDEPTIGLDIVAKRSLRETIKTVNKEQGTTVFLTSHDVGDIEEVCERTMIVNHGQIVLDAKTADLKKSYLQNKLVSVAVDGMAPSALQVYGIDGKSHKGRWVFEVDVSKVPLKKFLAGLLHKVEIADLTIEDTPLEDIIHELYTKAK
ncbi:MAG TPA: ATP-binding cassette domain-containing protein [Candidatus Saccharimonadales bacterium]|nr:ATP-binding cassette domain-containing protein [Candidatus Saccharimonadales bacterium]